MNTKESIAKKVVVEILDVGLPTSTWKENFPAAYDNLLAYRLDMEASVIKILNENEL